LSELSQTNLPTIDQQATRLNNVSGAPERPIESVSEDKLDRGPFVRRLVSALVDPTTRRSRGVVVGITGLWGSGKSSILNLLQENLKTEYPEAVVIRFDPWLVSGRNDLIAEFFRQLLARIGEEPTLRRNLKALAKTVQRYGEQVAPLISLANPIAGIAAQAGVKLLKARPADESLATLRKRVRDELTNAGVPLVVLIDELDRIEDAEIRAIAQLVRSVADFPTVSYVLAYDHSRVVQALGSDAPDAQRIKRGQAYLEKIVQYPIPIPLTFPEEILSLIEAEVAALQPDLAIPCRFQDDPRYKELTGLLPISGVETPRDVMRLVGTFHVLAGMLLPEVDWVDLLAFSALSIKAPSTAEIIRRDPGLACEEDLDLKTAKMSAEDRLSKILIGGEEEPIRELVEFLFPHLQPKSHGQRLYNRPAPHPDALRRRRPLLTTLRLGLLPGGFSRRQIVAVGEMAPGEIESFLREAYAGSEAKLANFIDHLEEIYGSLAEIDHVNFWKGVAGFLRKPDREWMTSFQPMYNIIQSFAGVLLKATQGTEAFAGIATKVFTNLRNADEDVLTVSWLRSQIFTHGLFNRERKPERMAFLTAEQTEACAKDLAKGLRVRHLAGQLIPCRWDLQPVYMMLDTGDWDEPCRSKLDKDLSDDRALDGFTLMLYGSFFTTDKATVEKMCSYDAYVARVADRLSSSEINLADESVRVALKKAADGGL